MVSPADPHNRQSAGAPGNTRHTENTGRSDARAGGDRLRGLPSGPRLTGDQARARSVMVRRLRIALPVGALALVAVFALNAGREGGDVALDDLAVTASADDLRMESPNFTGLDAKGNPFNITADAAIQTPGVANRVALERPKAVTSGVDSQSVVTARAGEFNSEDNILILNDDVTFEHRIGTESYVLITRAATVAIDDETVTSTVGVEGQGPDGATLKADRMRADNDEGTVRFEGNVRMRLYPTSDTLRPQIRDGSAPASAPPPAPEDTSPSNGEGNTP